MYICKYIYTNTITINETVVLDYLPTHYCFKLDFRKFYQHTGGKWLIHGISNHKDNQLQNLGNTPPPPPPPPPLL